MSMSTEIGRKLLSTCKIYNMTNLTRNLSKQYSNSAKSGYCFSKRKNNLVLNVRRFQSCWSNSNNTVLLLPNRITISSIPVNLAPVQWISYSTSASTDAEKSSSTGYDSSAKTVDRPGTLPSHNGRGVEIIYFRGLPQITVPLPSRLENCRFILKPLANSVGDLLQMIRSEDKGIDRIIVQSEDGVRIASSNTIEMLLEQNFELIINDKKYIVKTPPQEKPTQEEMERLSSVRNLVGQLYAALNVDEHQLRQEREMLAELEKLQAQLNPLEEKKNQISEISSKKTNTLTWVGLGLMSVQFGILARLTWWEYSWDIMEPVTYFVTYGTGMLAYAYFVLTKEDYVLPEVRDRQYLITFHKQARKVGLDVSKYNELREKISKIETDLKRLRDPLALHLPLKNRLPTESELKQLSSHLSGTESTAQSILTKAQNKLQQILQKSQQSS